ncbi:hypothetical protein Nmel_002163 [Mimus melanotis]
MLPPRAHQYQLMVPVVQWSSLAESLICFSTAKKETQEIKAQAGTTPVILFPWQAHLDLGSRPITFTKLKEDPSQVMSSTADLRDSWIMLMRRERGSAAAAEQKKDTCSEMVIVKAEYEKRYNRGSSSDTIQKDKWLDQFHPRHVHQTLITSSPKKTPASTTGKPGFIQQGPDYSSRQYLRNMEHLLNENLLKYFTQYALQEGSTSALSIGGLKNLLQNQFAQYLKINIINHILVYSPSSIKMRSPEMAELTCVQRKATDKEIAESFPDKTAFYYYCNTLCVKSSSSVKTKIKS